VIGRPIGLSHSEDCEDAEWDELCDECRENATHDWED